MVLNAFRIRLALIGAGILSMGIYLAMGGHFGPGHKGAIRIIYGANPDLFQGLRVEIDGEVAGVLKPFGSNTTTGFEVSEGDHIVRVLHPTMKSKSRTVHIDGGGGATLILDVLDTYTRGAGGQTVIGFQG